MSAYNQSPRRRTQSTQRPSARTSQARGERPAWAESSRPSTRTGARTTARQGGLSGLADRAMNQDGPQYLLIAALVAVVILALVVFTTVSSCAKRPATPQVEESPYSTLYDWEALSTEGGRYVYTVDDQKVSRLGIDVSDAQGEIDWDAVAKDGIEFAIVRVGYRGNTEGEVYTDANFDANIDGAIDAGLDVGAYFYSQALTEDEAREEAERCLYEINGRKLQYPVVFDFERTITQDNRGDTLDATQATANAKAFCEAIEEGGYQAMVYGNQNDLSAYNIAALGKYPIWYAEYGSLPTSNHEFTLWQYTNEGNVSGIDTVVDLNIDLSKAPRATDAAAEEEASK